MNEMKLTDEQKLKKLIEKSNENGYTVFQERLDDGCYLRDTGIHMYYQKDALKVCDTELILFDLKFLKSLFGEEKYTNEDDFLLEFSDSTGMDLLSEYGAAITGSIYKVHALQMAIKEDRIGYLYDEVFIFNQD